MYDEELKPKKVIKEKEVKEKRKISLPAIHIDFRSALKKIAILAVVVFAFIFITTKIGQGSENKVFKKNLETMRAAAYQYFKENDRPSEKDEEYVVTLQELIDEDYSQPLKDKKGNVCDSENSSVTLTKSTNTKFDLDATLACGEKEKEETFQLTYSASSSKKEDNEDQEETENVYYKLQKVVQSSNYEYSCPSGYTLSGTSCYSSSKTLTATPIAKYKTTNAKVSNASYKKPTDEYEYVDAIKVSGTSEYVCSDKNATLVGQECILTKDATMKKEANYTCSEGVLDGTKCVITIPATKRDYKYTCPSGSLVGDQCELTKDYRASYECPSDYPRRDGDRCYYSSKADRDYGSWHATSRKIYSKEMESKNSETTKYELVDTYDGSNGKTKYVYKVYTRKKEYICYDIPGEDVELRGSSCYHYISAYENKDCPYGYDLNDKETECVKYVDAKKTTSKVTYTCPDGYQEKGSKENTECVKKVSATKNIIQIPVCPSGYESTLNQDGTYSCQKKVEAKKVTTKDDYICPSGYQEKGSGANKKCYVKTTGEGYYYCKNSEARLEGEKCILDAKTELVGYSCPSGYDYNGSTCIRVTSGDKVKATKINNPDLEYTYKWSTKKEENGWTWTGETKEM